MKNINFWEKFSTFLAFLSALASAITNYSTTGKNYFWQLMVIVWVLIAFMKQRTIEEMDDKK
jgi:hypothetical protein